MAATNPSLSDELRSRNDCADRTLRRWTGMSFRLFKVIKATTQLVGMIAGIYAMILGADPITALMIMAAIWGGPEAVEVLLESGFGDTSPQSTDDSD